MSQEFLTPEEQAALSNSSQSAPAPKKRGQSKDPIAKHDQRQDQAKGQMVSAKTDLAKTVISNKKAEAKQISALGAREFVSTLLEEDVKHYQSITESLYGAGETLLDIGEAVALELASEESEDPLLLSAGSFSL